MSRPFLLFVTIAVLLAGCNPPSSSVPTPSTTPKPGETVSGGSTQSSSEETPKQPDPIQKEVGQDEEKTPADTSETGQSPLFKWGKNLPEAQAQAKKMSGYTLAKFEASWCAPCRIMKREAFQDKGIAKLLEKAVVVPIDGESPGGQVLMEKYKIDTYPTLVFIKPDGKVFGTIIGYMNVSWLDREVKRVFERAKLRD